MTLCLEEQSISIYPLRTRQLIDDIKLEYSAPSESVVLLLGNFEEERSLFRQESSFYYFTGIQEPAAVALISFNGTATLFIPHFGAQRDHWIYSPHRLNQEKIKQSGFDELLVIGEPRTGYQSNPFFDKKDFSELLKHLEQIIDCGGKIFTLRPSVSQGYVAQRLILERLLVFAPKLAQHIIDISDIVAQLRRSKDMYEIETMYKAVDITMLAHEAAIEVLGDNVPENRVQAAIDYVYAASGAQHAFPSIIGSGVRSTILHYNVNNSTMRDGDLVVIDIGAEYHYYAADLARTYPVSGIYTSRQREIYQIVLDTQEYVASIAAPGYFLVSKKYQDKSLHHLAQKFLEKYGYSKHFPHSIGHFLGLDVHDVGNYDIPLQEGDVITIEPGIYLHDEGIGVRIEDNYWIVEDSIICLSQELPKKIDDIEKYMAEIKAK